MSLLHVMQQSSERHGLYGRAPVAAPGLEKPELTATRAPQGLDLASEGVVLLDTDGRIKNINTRALRLLHCTTAGIRGHNFWEAVPEHIAEQHQASTRKKLADSGQHSFQAHHEFEDCWLDYSFTSHSDGYVVNLTDVTAKHKLQRQLEQSDRKNLLVFGANPNAMWIFDAVSLHIVAVNEAATDFYGVSRKAFMNLKMGALFPDGEGASLLSSLGPLTGFGDVQLTPQICKQKKGDGQLVLVELACGRISWADHHAVLVSIADVTERHLADRALRRENAGLEDELAANRAELENTKRDLAAFTYALSHDLQGPLHAVDGFASMLAEKYSTVLDGSGLHYINRIQASTRQLAGLVDNLRSLVQLPQLSGVTEIFDLKTLCDPLVDDLRRRYSGRQLTVEMEPGLMLAADRHLVTAALVHLLDNAWKFTGKKADGWIKVDVLAGEEPDERILQVSDNGTGFDTAYAGKLFTAFQRLHSSIEFPGNGLGLAIVKRVAGRHGGRVWAETSPAGASFFMSFPKGGVLGSRDGPAAAAF